VKKKSKIIAGSIVLAIIGFVIFVLTISATFTRQPDASLDFSRVIRDNVAADVRVVDIAMLGAHNAFTSGISRRSEACPHDGGMFANPATRRFAMGLFTRLQKSQKSDAAGLLARGVRYFDVRLTFTEDGWFTQRQLISAPFRDYLLQIINFLTQNPGELIVFDIQHANLGGASFGDLWDYIAGVTINGKSLFSFVTFDPYSTPLGQLTKGRATQHGAAAIILAKTPATSGGFHYEYRAAIRSTWHNQLRPGELIPYIQREYAFLRQNPQATQNMFRVNQAQTSHNFDSFGNIMYSLAGWSALNRSASHNVAMLNHEDFASWLGVMPIFMVGFADSPNGDFNARVVNKINEFNRNISIR